MAYVRTTNIAYSDDSFSITGPQLLSADLVRMTCSHRNDGGPARFIIGDHLIDATVANIRDHDKRGMTCVGNDIIIIRNIEHILSALNGMCVLDTNIKLEYIDRNIRESKNMEISPPVVELNSRDFAMSILSSFRFANRDLNTQPNSVHLDRAYVFTEDDTSKDPAHAVFTPLHRFHITVVINFPYFWGQQTYSQAINPVDYLRSICWARSFFGTPFPHNSEWQSLRNKYPGLIRERESHFRSLMLDYSQTAWITPLLVNTEPVRHKMLDFIGDIALLGSPLKASVFIYKPSHRFNRECAIQLARAIGISED